jgi:hypothetical protein
LSARFESSVRPLAAAPAALDQCRKRVLAHWRQVEGSGFGDDVMGVSQG